VKNIENIEKCQTKHRLFEIMHTFYAKHLTKRGLHGFKNGTKAVTRVVPLRKGM